MPIPTEDVMDERRKVQRHRTLKAGSITFNRDGGFDWWDPLESTCRHASLSIL